MKLKASLLILSKFLSLACFSLECHADGCYCFITWNYFTKESPLVPSGLLGPITLQCAE